MLSLPLLIVAPLVLTRAFYIAGVIGVMTPGLQLIVQLREKVGIFEDDARWYQWAAGYAVLTVGTLLLAIALMLVIGIGVDIAPMLGIPIPH